MEKHAQSAAEPVHGALVSVPDSVHPLLATVGHIARQLGMPAYAVGGCVRDWLLGIEKTTDLDVTVEGDGLAVARVAAATFNAAVTIHEQFGTATLAADALRLDIATCRKERYARPAAYPQVSPGTLADDLRRRDFTINAMAVEISPERFGALCDPYGGARHLRAKQLRILHPKSFLDDPSRILRGIRFVERFQLRWERATERALREAVAQGALGWLNAGRLHKELMRMTEEPHPRRCFRHLARLLRIAS
ncbi:MAG: CCA tRNA nucleotidyltransferase [Candidatus Omnitrophica bacterium]|nr:CCA tRNA nucleotidyltransferase [Candidatus Omnitrophota bacterium]